MTLYRGDNNTEADWDNLAYADVSEPLWQVQVDVYETYDMVGENGTKSRRLKFKAGQIVTNDEMVAAFGEKPEIDDI